MLQMMIIILMHMNQLTTIYVMGSNVNQGSQVSKRSDSPKLQLVHNLLRAMVMLLMYVKGLLTLYTSCAPIVDQGSNGVTGVKRSKLPNML